MFGSGRRSPNKQHFGVTNGSCQCFERDPRLAAEDWKPSFDGTCNLCVHGGGRGAETSTHGRVILQFCLHSMFKVRLRQKMNPAFCTRTLAERERRWGSELCINLRGALGFEVGRERNKYSAERERER